MSAQQKTSKAALLREQTSEQLQYQMQEAQKELFQLRFQAATEKRDAPSKLRKLRREIARIKTILHQRELAAAPSTKVN
ncbi:MAG: 50S ribosomal protein L29 [Planctomycetaceae bacterium]|nr:MAG: 50S ribosomal protein L29 [Planctomycetaceae bacterium]